jgi:TrmH family RNA methyltransferase
MERMLSKLELDRLCVVLVRARNCGNIGAAARAIRDFGFSRLRVVNEYAVPFEDARSAVDASEVVANAKVCASVAEAVADCTLVVGTTAVGERTLDHELLALPQAEARIRAELRRSVDSGMEGGLRVALLFGSEKTGLSNEELSHCHWLLTIPMHQLADARHVSMNLGQAVAVCLYELVREAPMDVPDAVSRYDDDKSRPAGAAALERVTKLLSEVMEATEYTRRHAANSEPAQVRRLVRRIAMDAIDAPVWMGILRQVLWKLGRPRRQ